MALSELLSHCTADHFTGSPDVGSTIVLQFICITTLSMSLELKLYNFIKQINYRGNTSVLFVPVVSQDEDLNSAVDNLVQSICFVTISSLNKQYSKYEQECIKYIGSSCKYVRSVQG